MKATASGVRKGLSLALLAGVFSFSGLGAQRDDPAKSNHTLRVDVDMVLVHVTVTDSRNRFVQDLPKKRFQIWEDKIEQEVVSFSSEDAPVTLGIVLDKSGSMGGRRPSNAPLGPLPPAGTPLQSAISSAYSCIEDPLRDDEFFLIEFSDTPMVVADFTDDVWKLRERLLFTGAGGGTALWDAIYAGVMKAVSGTKSRKALLVLTDGLENRSRYTLNELKGALREQDVRIYAMYREQAARDGLASLADATGGQIFRSSEPCKQLQAELRNQYVIGYSPTNKAADGAWRQIRVRVDTKGLPRELSELTVRARTGYYAKSDSGGGRAR